MFVILICLFEFFMFVILHIYICLKVISCHIIILIGMNIPTVQFDNGLVTTIGPVEYEYKGNDGCIVRSQVPLKLGLN